MHINHCVDSPINSFRDYPSGIHLDGRYGFTRITDDGFQMDYDFKTGSAPDQNHVRARLMNIAGVKNSLSDETEFSLSLRTADEVEQFCTVLTQEFGIEAHGSIWKEHWLEFMEASPKIISYYHSLELEEDATDLNCEWECDFHPNHYQMFYAPANEEKGFKASFDFQWTLGCFMGQYGRQGYDSTDPYTILIFLSALQLFINRIDNEKERTALLEETITYQNLLFSHLDNGNVER